MGGRGSGWGQETAGRSHTMCRVHPVDCDFWVLLLSAFLQHKLLSRTVKQAKLQRHQAPAISCHAVMMRCCHVAWLRASLTRTGRLMS